MELEMNGNRAGVVIAEPTATLTERQQTLLKDLHRTNASIDGVNLEDAAPEDAWRALDACVRGLKLLEARVCRLHPIIGRILLLFQAKPEMYRTLGYSTYTDFMVRGVYSTLGLRRASAYQGRLVARDWPQIGPELYVKLGPKK